MRPWQITAAGVIMVAATYGWARYSYGLFLPDIRLAFDLDARWLGFIASASYAGYLIATIAASILSGRLGPRWPLIVGGVCASCGMAGVAVARSAGELTIALSIAGASPGLAYTALSDVIVRTVSPSWRERVYSIVNSGTSFGVIVAGPLAILAGADWRGAWIVFSIIALAGTIWAGMLAPNGSPTGQALSRLSLDWFRRAQSGSLFASAFLLGIATSVYWTFSVDLITAEAIGRTDQSTHFARLFWMIIGISGIGGVIAGDLVRCFGLRRVLTASLLALASATGLLAAAPAVVPAVYISALAFGGAFVIGTAMFGIWSIHLFIDRPSAGFGFTFLTISVGQLVGPSIAGLLASSIGLPATFALAAASYATLFLLLPRENIREISS